MVLVWLALLMELVWLALLMELVWFPVLAALCQANSHNFRVRMRSLQKCAWSHLCTYIRYTVECPSID
jgi:hypothetical protein